KNREGHRPRQFHVRGAGGRVRTDRRSDCRQARQGFAVAEAVAHAPLLVPAWRRSARNAFAHIRVATRLVANSRDSNLGGARRYRGRTDRPTLFFEMIRRPPRSTPFPTRRS